MTTKVHEKPKEELVKPETGLSTINFADDFNQYQDTFDKGSLQIPFLRILQSNSAQVTAGEASYIEEARPGMFINTVTGDLTKRLEVIPAYHRSTYIEWVPRTEGGGFVKDWGFEEGEKLLATCSKRPDSNRDMLPNGNDLIRTEVYFVLLIDEEGGCSQAMLTMTSTQLKKARSWNSKKRMQKTAIPGKGKVADAPWFFNSWVLTTTPEKNDSGSWHGYVIAEGRPTLEIGEAMYLAAKDFRQTVEEGIQKGTISMKNAADEPAKEDAPF